MPLVSILIPAHNAAPWIAATIESALAQTWTELEIIVVDDGSTDDTLTIARNFEARGVRVLTQKNQGASAARNHAWNISRGEWLQFLDADDLLHPDKIAHQLERALQLGPDFAYCARWTRFTRTIDDADHTPQPLCRNSAPMDWMEIKLRDNLMMHPAAWLIARSLAARAGQWDQTLTLDDDGEFFSRIVVASQGVRFCDQALTYYRSNLASSLSGRRSPQAWASAFRSLQLTAERLLALESTPRLRGAIANAYQELAFAMYPDETKLASKCEQMARSMGGSSNRPGGGLLFRLISQILGWRVARRIQRWRTTRRTADKGQ